MILRKGLIYSCTYLNFHNDRNPLLLVLYSDSNYVIGLNLHYIKKSEYDEIIVMFNELQKKYATSLFKQDPRAFYYNWLKPKFQDFIDVAYRMYHTNLIMGMVAHPVLLRSIGSKWMNRLNKRSPNYYFNKEEISSNLEKDKQLKYLRNESPTKKSIDTFLSSLKR